MPPWPPSMANFSGNRALLQAFLADAERYLGEFMAALADPVEDAAVGTALEALRGIRIGAEFLKISPLAELCRQLENSLAHGLRGGLPDDARESLVGAGKAIHGYLSTLGGGDGYALAPAGNPQALRRREAPAYEAAELPAPTSPAAEFSAAAPVAGTTASGGEAPAGETAPAEWSDAAARSDIDAEAGRAARVAEPAVGEMFEAWMQEWRAFRRQVECLCLSPPQTVPGQPSAGVIPAPGNAAVQPQAPEVSAPAVQAPVALADAAPRHEPPAPPPSGQVAAADSSLVAVLKLSIGDRLFALPAASVLGFVEPGRAAWQLSENRALAGVNGTTVPIADLGQRWNLGTRCGDARIILVDGGGARAGLWADGVHGTETLRIQALEPAACYPAAFGGAALGAQGEVVLLLLPQAVVRYAEEA